MSFLTGILPKQRILDMAFQFQDDHSIYGASWQHLSVNTLGFSGAVRHTCCRYVWNPHIWHATSLNPPPEPGSSEHSFCQSCQSVNQPVRLSDSQTLTRHSISVSHFTHGGSSRSSSRTPSLIWTPNPKGIQFSRSRRESLG